MKNCIYTSLLVQIVVSLLFLCSFNIVGAASEGNINISNYCYEEILSIESGLEDYQINYNLGYNEKSDNTLLEIGVETFSVDDNERVYLSNFASGKIKVFHENQYEQEIDISDFSQPRDIKADGSSIFIFEDKGKITEISICNNKEAAIYTIPDIIDNEKQKNKEKRESIYNKSIALKFVNDFFYNNQISLLYSNNLLFSFENEDKYYNDYIFNNDNFDLKFINKKSYKQLIGIDNNGFIYILGIEISSKDDEIDISELLFKFNKTGKLVGIAETANYKNHITPYKYLDMNMSGDVFQLLVLDDMVKVLKLNFKDIEEFEKLVNEKTADKTTVGSVFSSKPDILLEKNIEEYNYRNNLYERAERLLNLEWTYIPDINAGNLDNVVIPYYLEEIINKKELTGIPYCWGGYDSLSTKSKNQDWDNFVDAVSRGNTAGNVGITVNYVPQTVGLDCSGLVSAVLGLDSRQASWYFKYDNDLVKKISYSQLDLMDILVKDGHMMFYVDENAHGITTIESNILGSEWKVKYFNWSWRALCDMGYMARGIIINNN